MHKEVIVGVPHLIENEQPNEPFGAREDLPYSAHENFHLKAGIIWNCAAPASLILSNSRDN